MESKKYIYNNREKSRKIVLREITLSYSRDKKSLIYFHRLTKSIDKEKKIKSLGKSYLNA